MTNTPYLPAAEDLFARAVAVDVDKPGREVKVFVAALAEGGPRIGLDINARNLPALADPWTWLSPEEARTLLSALARALEFVG
jgi:hypothetical protein